MLAPFDWLRRARTGAELLAILKCLVESPEVFAGARELGAPLSALGGPCQRCWIYARAQGRPLCRACQAIQQRQQRLAQPARRAAVLWGFVDQLPSFLQEEEAGRRTLGAYIHDRQRFLLALRREELKPWLQEWVIRHGAERKGLVQILPAVGVGASAGMGELLCRAISYEAQLSMDRMRVRFYTDPAQLMAPHRWERQRVLSFEIDAFLGLLDMAEVFRALLRPEEQRELFEVLGLQDSQEGAFYWGRFLGRLERRTRDMLAAWGMRAWPQGQIRLFSHLLEYVALPPLP